MPSISFFARQAMNLIVKDVKADFNMETEETATPKPPKIDQKKEARDLKKAQLLIQVYWHFKLKKSEDEGVVARILAYFMFKYSTSAGHGLVRLKTDSHGKTRVKPYNPHNYFHRRKYKLQASAAELLAFDCEATKKEIQESLHASLVFEGVINSNSDRRYLDYNILKMFEWKFRPQLEELFS